MEIVNNGELRDIDVSSVTFALKNQAPLIQQWLLTNDCLDYSLNDIQAVLADWIEATIIEIAQEALYHCVSGDSSNAIGRRDFKHFLDKKPYEEITHQTTDDTDTEAA